MTEERELKDTLDAVYDVVTAFQKSLPDDFDEEMLCAFILTVVSMARGGRGISDQLLRWID